MRSFQRNHRKRYAVVVALWLGVVPFLVGCEAESNSAIPGWTSPVSAQSPESQAQPFERVPTTIAQASRRSVCPESTVRSFMSAIQMNDVQVRDEMLSDAARRNLERTRLGLEMATGTVFTFSVGPSAFSGENSARVACTLTESDERGVQIRSCEWILRQEPVRGWRITGVSIPTVTGDSTVLLDFEHMEETLLRIAAIR